MKGKRKRILVVVVILRHRANGLLNLIFTFHKKGCAPSLILKVRLFGTWMWPICDSVPDNDCINRNPVPVAGSMIKRQRQSSFTPSLIENIPRLRMCDPVLKQS